MKKVLILVCFLIVLSGIGIASAATVTGELGTGDIGWESKNYYVSPVNTGYPCSGTPSTLVFYAVEYSSNFKSLILFNNGAFSNSTITSGSVPVTVKDGETVYGTGTLGFYRSFTGTPPVENYKYVYLSMDSWTIPSGASGTKYLTIDGYNSTLLGTTITLGGMRDAVKSGDIPTSIPGFWVSSTYASYAVMNYTANRDVEFKNAYTATSPSGLGITGNVSKTVGGTVYPSQVYIVDANSGILLASDYTITSVDFSFNVVNPDIYIAVKTDTGNWYNTSTISFTTPTVTPTVTMTPVPTVAPGYVRSNVWVMDHLGNSVHGVDIAMYDVEGTTWSNSTSDADGQHYIDTLPYHTLNLYADFTAFPGEFLPSSLLGVETGYYGNGYYLVLYPAAAPAGEGNTNLYITVMDEDTGDLIRAASLTVTYGTTTQGGTTGTTGTEIFVVPNQTDVRIAASKAGYTSATQYLNSGTGTVVNTQIELSRLLVTTVPTSTIPPGGVTPAVTVDPNDPSITGSTNAKGQEMLNWLAMHGMDLVQLCFLVTMLALLGVKLGK